MKARLLTKLLNNTGYNVNNNKDYIAVGSPLCHNLISVDKKTLKVEYALDTFHEGRKCLERKDTTELLFIWDKLHELIKSDEIKDIIEGNDEIENPLPVYTVEDGKLIETCTDEFGWPNKTIEGETMYDNTYFKTRSEAIKYGIKEAEAGIKIYTQRQKELEEKLEDLKRDIEKEKSDLDYLKSISFTF